MNDSTLAGTVTLVASAGGVLSTDAVGFADLESSAPMAPDSVFRIASMTKPITAIAIMMAVDDGLVDLDAPVTDHLPDYRPRVMAMTDDRSRVELRAPRRPITVRMLLNHTSGLPFTSVVETAGWDAAPLATQVQGYALTPLLFEPGEDFLYSNAGINAAARVLEVAAGMPYEDVLQQRIFDPLGMSDTTFWPNDAQAVRLVTAYRRSPRGLEAVATRQSPALDDRDRRFPVPGSGLYSTAGDMAAFCRMVLSGGELDGRRYVSTKSLREMSTNHLDPDTQPGAASLREGPEGWVGYGLGWLIAPDDAFGHSGGSCTMMRIYPKHGIVAVWLAQYDLSPEASTVLGTAYAAVEKSVLDRFGSDHGR